MWFDCVIVMKKLNTKTKDHTFVFIRDMHCLTVTLLITVAQKGSTGTGLSCLFSLNPLPPPLVPFLERVSNREPPLYQACYYA